MRQEFKGKNLGFELFKDVILDDTMPKNMILIVNYEAWANELANQTSWLSYKA